jgi:hypothetical protein
MGSFSWLAVTGPANAKAATYANIVANHILEKFVARPILYAMSKNCSTRQMFLGTSLRPFGVCKEREGGGCERRLRVYFIFIRFLTSKPMWPVKVHWTQAKLRNMNAKVTPSPSRLRLVLDICVRCTQAVYVTF